MKDDLNREMTLGRPARRILSLSPAIAENLAAIGALPYLVGVTTADNFPPEVMKLPRIGDFGQPSYERILALKPDLAIVEIGKIDAATIANAEKRMRCPIFVQVSRTYDDVPRHLEQLGQLTGQTAKARQVAQQMRSIKQKVMRQVAGKPPVTVFVEVSREPLYTAGPGSFIDDLIRTAGGTNIVKGDNPYPVFSRETLLAADPQHYIVASGSDMKPSDLALSPPLDRIAAAKSGNIHVIRADFLFRPTPRLAGGLKALALALHGRQ